MYSSAAAPTIQYRNDENLRAKTNGERAGKLMQATKQGLVTDVFINSRENNSDTPANTPLPPDLTGASPDVKEKRSGNGFLWMVGVPLGVLAAGTITTGLFAADVKKNYALLAKNPNAPTLKVVNGIKKLFTKNETGPKIPLTFNLITEEHVAAYEFVRNPSLKTMLGAIAVFSFSTAALALKNTVDGVKEIAVKQKSADIQRNYQEKMIAIETRSFAGKKQLIRHMLDQKTAELNAINRAKNISFGANKRNTDYKTDEKQGLKLSHILIGAGAIAASVLLIRQTMKNIKDIGKILKIVAETPVKSKTATFKEKGIGGAAKVLTQKVKGLFKGKRENMPESSWDMPDTIYGKKKPTMFAFLNNASGHLYHMIMSPSKLQGGIFASFAAVSGVSYAGTRFVEANREIQVKKAEADINLDMNNKLVRVELANFMTKKNAAVAPLVDDYKAEANKKYRDKEGLKAKYNGILEEIKNGPPFVYD